MLDVSKHGNILSSEFLFPSPNDQKSCNQVSRGEIRSLFKLRVQYERLVNLPYKSFINVPSPTIDPSIVTFEHQNNFNSTPHHFTSHSRTVFFG
jgi:hypothetical protein